VARELQASLLPSKTPQISNWEFAAYWKPAREVAGDYYDFVPLDDGRLGLVIADVSDKGMSAALFMALTRSVLRASVAGTKSPANGIAHANRLICADATRGMFVTLFYALLNPLSGDITYVNAGHNPPLLARADENRMKALTRTGMALGVVEDPGFEERTLHLDPGDFILLYTDGVTDATDAHQQKFGMERLQRVVLDNRREAAMGVVSALERSLEEFVGSTPPFDDVAIVVARCLK